MQITRKSQVSGIEHTMDLDITEDQINRWRSGEPIQRAFPNLSPSQREFLMTGITDDEWESVFGQNHDC